MILLGLEQLTLSSNPGISTKGWIQFFVAMASSNMLHSLDLDYNSLGNTGVHCLTVALASSRFMESLDLEGTGITEKGGKVNQVLLKNDKDNFCLNFTIKTCCITCCYNIMFSLLSLSY